MNERILKERFLEVNLHIDSLNDFMHTSESYPEAIPILIDALKEDFDSIYTKDAIVRALTVKEAKGLANKPLLEEYNRTDKQLYDNYCWVIGGAFTVIIVPDDVDPILEIAKNKDNSTSRQMFIYSLAKIKKRKEDIEDVLIPLLDDEDVIGHTLHTLGILKSQKAKEKIIPLLNHSNAYFRRSAKSALKRIEKQ